MDAILDNVLASQKRDPGPLRDQIALYVQQRIQNWMKNPSLINVCVQYSAMKSECPDPQLQSIRDLTSTNEFKQLVANIKGEIMELYRKLETREDIEDSEFGVISFSSDEDDIVTVDQAIRSFDLANLSKVKPRMGCTIDLSSSMRKSS